MSLQFVSKGRRSPHPPQQREAVLSRTVDDVSLEDRLAHLAVVSIYFLAATHGKVYRTGKPRRLALREPGI